MIKVTDEWASKSMNGKRQAATPAEYGALPCNETQTCSP